MLIQCGITCRALALSLGLALAESMEGHVHGRREPLLPSFYFFKASRLADAGVRSTVTF